uniref:Uncharacterized protein n=1 Tax=Cacopsylla melanoneura TaxID=428564 RepID=A0A8D9BHI7_9HEMI
MGEVQVLIKEISELLKSGGFHLHKFYSNIPDVLNNQDQSTVIFDSDDAIKTLGLQWKPNTDVFVFSVQPYTSTKVTKRTILSEIGKIFDPLRLINPITLKAKLIMQGRIVPFHGTNRSHNLCTLPG